MSFQQDGKVQAMAMSLGSTGPSMLDRVCVCARVRHRLFPIGCFIGTGNQMKQALRALRVCTSIYIAAGGHRHACHHEDWMKSVAVSTKSHARTAATCGYAGLHTCVAQFQLCVHYTIAVWQVILLHHVTSPKRQQSHAPCAPKLHPTPDQFFFPTILHPYSYSNTHY